MARENLATGSDLMLYTLFAASQTASVNDDYAQTVKAAIRQSYWEVLMLEPWWFAKNELPGIITTVAKQQVTLASVSGSVITLAANITPSMIYRKFFLSSTQTVYRIIAHTSGTNTMTLDAPYLETNTAGGAIIFQDEYVAPSDCLKPWGPVDIRGQFERQGEIIGEKEFKARYGWNTVSAIGIIEAMALVGTDPAGNRLPLLRVGPWSEQQINLEFPYTKFHDLDFTGSAATDTPRIPLPDRWVVAERALFTLFRDKDDTLATTAEQKAQRKIEEMRNFHLSFPSRDRMWTRPRFGLGG